jgi:hypothetical protein
MRSIQKYIARVEREGISRYIHYSELYDIITDIYTQLLLSSKYK